MKGKKLTSQTGKPRRAKVDWKALEIVHPDAAGIDVGGMEHWVAISPDRDEDSVRRFGCFTADLEQMARWLIDKGVQSVAMQSTGVYWMPVYEVLEQSGLEVYLVNARHTKNLPGRKSDVQECQWLLKLHTFGLLNNSFQPTDEIRVTRTIWRHGGNLVAQAGSAVQRMQKALTEMNVQLHTVLSDLSGVSGMAILKAILNGERDPRVLAALVHSSESVTGRYCQESTRKLAQGIVTGAATRTGTLPGTSRQDHRMRRIAKAPAVGGVESRPPDTTLRPEAQREKGPRECSEI